MDQKYDKKTFSSTSRWENGGSAHGNRQSNMSLYLCSKLQRTAKFFNIKTSQAERITKQHRGVVKRKRSSEQDNRPNVLPERIRDCSN